MGHRVHLYGQQFANYSIGLPVGAHINPALTAGENIADFGGLNIALDAYLVARQKEPHCQDMHSGGRGSLEDSIQTLFVADAQSWREMQRPEALLAQLIDNP